MRLVDRSAWKTTARAALIAGIGLAALTLASEDVRAQCTIGGAAIGAPPDNVAAGQTVICTGASTDGIDSVDGDNNITVDVQAGAALNSPANDAIVMFFGSNHTVTVAATGALTGTLRGIVLNNTTTSSVTIAGTVTGTNFEGVLFIGGSGNVIDVTATGVVTGGTEGIRGANSASATITLAGTVTGGTAIDWSGGNALTLELRSGFVLNGTVLASNTVDNTLRLGGAANGNFDLSLIGPAAQFRNFDFLEKTGASTWTLAGTTAFTGPTDIQAGTLLLAGGAALPSDVTVNVGGAIGGATLGGNATVASVTFNALSAYVVTVSPTQATRITATGMADLGGANVVVTTTNGTYQPSQSYVILTANGGLNGAFAPNAAINVNGFNPFLFTATVANVGNDVILTLACATCAPGGAGGFSSIALTPNQKAVAGAMDTLGVSAPFFGNFAALGLDNDAIRAGLDALSGEVHGSVRGVINRPGAMFVSTLRDRLAGAFDAFGGQGALAYNAPLPEGLRGTLPDLLVEGRSLGSGADLPIEQVRGLSVRPSNLVWLSVAGRSGSIDGDGNAAGVDANALGVFGGVDLPMAPNLRVGLAGGWSRTDADADARLSTARSNAWHVAGTLAAAFGDFRLRGLVAGSGHDIDTTRNIVIGGTSVGVASASYGAARLEALAELGYVVRLAAAQIEPYVGLGVSYLRVDGFTETGAGAGNLTAAEERDATPYGLIGIRLSTRWASGGMVITPRLDLAWRHAFDEVDATRRVAFASAPAAPWTVQGTPIARSAALVSAGLEAAISDRLSAGLRYRGEFASDAQDHSVTGTLTLRF